MPNRVLRADVARAAGVSPTTVSLVMNGSDVTITQETRDRVRTAASELGYRPHWIAQALRTGRTNIIGVWLGSREAMDNGVISFIEEQLVRRDYEMLITYASKAPDWRTHFERCSEWPVDGVLAVDAPNYVEALCEGEAGARRAIVGVGGSCSPKADAVQLDVGAGARLVLHHISEQGCRRIAYVVRKDANGLHDPRYLAYVTTMREAGLHAEIIPVSFRLGWRNRLRAHRVMRRQFARSAPPDGIFCYSDDIALGTLRAALEAGLRVPEDVMIAGHGGIGDTSYVWPKITTVGYNYRKMCSIAWEMLYSRMADPSRPIRRVVMPPKLSCGESTRRAQDSALRSQEVPTG